MKLFIPVTFFNMVVLKMRTLYVFSCYIFLDNGSIYLHIIWRAVPVVLGVKDRFLSMNAGQFIDPTIELCE